MNPYTVCFGESQKKKKKAYIKSEVQQSQQAKVQQTSE